MIDDTLIQQLLARAGVVANETEDSANDANRIGTLFADIIRALSMLITEEELAQLISQYGSRLFLSKVNPDTAAERIIMAKGVQLGESFASGMTGHGGLLDGQGRAEMRSLKLWEWLEVPELRKNRTRIIVGDEWQAPGGIIESVDTDNQTITLKLEEGEIGLIEEDDLCMGYWNDPDTSLNSRDTSDDGRNNRRIAGFATSYFRLTRVSGSRNENAEYVLRGQSEAYPNPYHPQVGMHFVVFGNPTKTDRQNSAYRTRTYTRYVKGVTTWEFSAANIAMQFGDLSNLSLLGINMQGYSAYLNNIYLTGHIEDVEVSGAHLEIQMLNGGWVDALNSETVTFSAKDGLGRDITGHFTGFKLTRESGDESADRAWNATHTPLTSPVTLTKADMGTLWFVRRTLFTLESLGGDETIRISFAIGVRDHQDLHIEFVASRNVVYVDDVNVTVEARLFYGEEDVTDELLLQNTTATEWKRDSGVVAEDAAWTPTFGTTRNKIVLQHGPGYNRRDCGSQWEETLHCSFDFKAVLSTGLNQQQTITENFPLGI